MPFPSRTLAALFALAVLVTGCGGGNAGSTPVSAPEPPLPSAPPAPTASADPGSGPPTAPPPPATDASPPLPGGVRGLTAEQVRDVVVARRAGLRACYEPEAQKHPGLRGAVTVAWTVDEMGNVSAAAVTDSTVRDDVVDACVLRQVRGWRFPNSDGDTQATFPFQFGSTEREGDRTEVNGHLPPEAIKHVIKLNFGRFRQCYENGLLGNPKLSGRVTVRFVIDRTGGVTSQADAGSELPDASVVACVIRAFGALQFPQPEGGTVSVVYPIVFNPRD